METDPPYIQGIKAINLDPYREPVVGQRLRIMKAAFGNLFVSSSPSDPSLSPLARARQAEKWNVRLIVGVSSTLALAFIGGPFVAGAFALVYFSPAGSYLWEHAESIGSKAVALFR
ncbi:MAG: hypothetical protein AB7F31_07655 [Parachlamydiales bacterium]